MDTTLHRTTNTAPRTSRPLGIRSRAVSGTAFACVFLAFLLPFGSVSSCSSGEEVRFTGIQLATAQVPPDEHTPGDLDRKVENDATLLAFLTLAAAVIGIGLALGGELGGGVCAGAGLLGLQLLLLVGLAAWDDFSLYEGYGFSLLAFVIAGLTHLALQVRLRRREGMRSWTYALRSIALAFSPTLAVVGLVLVAGAAGGLA